MIKLTKTHKNWLVILLLFAIAFSLRAFFTGFRFQDTRPGQDFTQSVDEIPVADTPLGRQER